MFGIYRSLIQRHTIIMVYHWGIIIHQLTYCCKYVIIYHILFIENGERQISIACILTTCRVYWKHKYDALGITFTQVLNLLVIISPITVTVKTVRGFLCVQPFVHLPSKHPPPPQQTSYHACSFTRMLRPRVSSGQVCLEQFNIGAFITYISATYRSIREICVSDLFSAPVHPVGDVFTCEFVIWGKWPCYVYLSVCVYLYMVQ